MAASKQNELPEQTATTSPSPNITTALPFPLPPGIFENGTTFYPLAFIKKVTHLYEQVMINKEGGNSMLQDEAFATLLMGRTVTLEDGAVAFKMIDCETPPSTPDGLIIQIEGLKYLRLDCLQDNAAA